MFDATLQVIDIQVSVPEPDAKVGPDGGVMTMAWILGLMLPVGPGQAMPLPAGIVRANIGKEQAEKLGEAISKGAKNLKPASKLVRATDVKAAEQAAEAVQGFRDGPER